MVKLTDTYRLFNSNAQGDHLAKALKELTIAESHYGPVGLDTETTGLDPFKDRVRLVQIATPTDCIIVDLDAWRTKDVTGKVVRDVPWSKPGLKELKVFLEGSWPKVIQNAAFDLNMLRAEGIVVGGPIFDTMIASQIITNGTNHKNDLGSIVLRYLKIVLPKELQKADWGGELTDDMLRYAARDGKVLPMLAGPIRAKLKSNKLNDSVSLFDVFCLEMQALRPIAYMQWYGFKFDRTKAATVLNIKEQDAARLKMEFLLSLDSTLRSQHPHDESKWLPRDPDGSLNLRKTNVGRGKNKMLAGFNPGSTSQMAKAFTNAGIILPPAKAKPGKPFEPGKVSLDQNLLAFLRGEYPLVDQYMTWSTADTKVSCVQTLIKAAAAHGDRIHCRYMQMGTATGRLSANSPNLQQVPKDAAFRSLFIAESGFKLVVADFSQLELRVAAELSQEPRMIKAYAEDRDLHIETASLIARLPIEEVTKAMRTSAKIANFGLLYGAGPATFQRQALAQYGILYFMPECKKIVDGFREAYPRLYEWQQQEGQSRSTSVYTRYGRRRILVGFNDKYTIRLNTPVQGTGGDIAKIAMSMLWPYLILAGAHIARLIAIVHDELVLEVREDLAEYWGGVLKKCMEDAGSIVCKSVPIIANVGIGYTWADAK